MLFLIVSLFVLVIITVYQSEMTNLLAKAVRYPEIDTLEDLKDSDLMIQTPDLEATLELLQDYPFYDAIKTKLSEGPYYYRRVLNNYIIEQMGITSNFFEFMAQNISQAKYPSIRRFNDLRYNFQSIVASNAVELAVSDLYYKIRGNIKMGDPLLPDNFAEFHVMKECMLTYPLAFQVQKNSYVSDFFIEEIRTYVEKGLVLKFLDDTCFYPEMKCAYSMNHVTEDGHPPAFAFTIENVQPAFVSLITGWILSGVVFAVELMVDILNEIGNPRFARWAEKLVRPSSLWV
ncbi:unnamed protein product [Bemisia tabaci]|uniref:Ionotropic receptor n=1 Tax=Bemisia tabaci TaxID=7038 RepID=A0A9P0AI52_BEMTA|nr:unnamed protein product [Bemisia tabaci]